MTEKLILKFQEFIVLCDSIQSDLTFLSLMSSSKVNSYQITINNLHHQSLNDSILTIINVKKIFSENCNSRAENTYTRYQELSTICRSLMVLISAYKIEHNYETKNLKMMFSQHSEKYLEYFKYAIFKDNLDFNSVMKTIDEIISKNGEMIDEDLSEMDLNDSQEKILFLEKIGVIDFLRKKYAITSNGKLGEVLFPITKIKPDTIRKYLERIQKGEIKNGVETSVVNTINKLKLKIDN